MSLVDPDKVTLVALALGALLAFVAAMRITKIKNNNTCTRRKQTITSCWLGCNFTTNVSSTCGIFAKSGVGQVVSDLVGQVLPTEYPFVAVMAYCLGMMLFTVVMEMHSQRLLLLLAELAYL